MVRLQFAYRKATTLPDLGGVTAKQDDTGTVFLELDQVNSHNCLADCKQVEVRPQRL